MISRFSGEYAFLSNFFIEPDGTHVEGEYQASKTIIRADWVASLSPRDAKAVGRKLKLRPDFETVKVQIMYQLVFSKFNDHPELKKKLLATYPEQLVEGNYWGDRFWGVYNGSGQNWLGRILMEVRDRFRLEEV